MIDYLVSIPGPTFLAFFTGLAILLIGYAWLMEVKTYQDLTTPDFTQFDYVGIALLGGIENVIRCAIFNLWSDGTIEIEGSGSNSSVSAIGAVKKGENAVERALISYLGHQHILVSDLFNSPSLATKIKRFSQIQKRHLTNVRLLKSESDLQNTQTRFISVVLILVLLGGLKVFLGAINKNPIGFLVVLLIVSIVILVILVPPAKPISLLGKKYVKGLKKHFSWMVKMVQTGKLPQGVSPGMVLAIFGTGILKDHSRFAPFQKSFRKADSDGGGSCGGCGGFSSGSDGGGGSCGGCGGCGD